MPDKLQLLDAIRLRDSRSGIITADRYFREIEGCFGDGFCPVKTFGASSPEAWKSSLEAAESTLTFRTEGMRVLRKSMVKNTGGGILQFDAIITTPHRDRDGDILETKGAQPDPSMPLLWQHIAMQPIGKMVSVLKHTEQSLKGRFVIADTPLGRDAAELVSIGALRISHGFMPLDYELLEDEKGFLIKSFEIFETSLVSIPSNVQAVVTAVNRGKLTTPLVKAWADGMRKAAGETPCTCKKTTVAVTADIPKSDWRKEFDVERQHVEAAKLEYDWISRFCSCEVKQLVNFSTHSARIRMGSFLTGLKHALEGSVEVDARRLTGAGTETPLEYETIQLNSKEAGHFLVDGISFRRWKDGTCFALKFTRDWSGEYVDVYAARKDEQRVSSLIGTAWAWATENNFLKGEAFSLTGEFLPKTAETWGDLFLDPANEREVKRAVDLLNAKGKSTPNRGIIMMGPPGTGKTLSIRLMRNHANATFIWVGGKDAYYFGAVGSILEAFELAKELAPAIIAFEDIDASFSYDRPIDVLKTEMDGVGRSSGIETVLTTNHPKMLPEALLDRPGRFHDVLKFDLPSKDVRRAMLAKWLPNLTEKELGDVSDATNGYSGAHVYELCQYAKTISESEELAIGDAVTKALTKIADQRELIDQELTAGGRIAARRRNEPVPSVKSRSVLKSVSPVRIVVGQAMKSRDIETEYLAAMATADTDALRKAHRRLSLVLSHAEEQEQAKERDQLLALLTN